MKRINLDINAGYTDREILEQTFARISGISGNPSSIHCGGQKARALIEEARSTIAASLGLSPAQKIVFTSGATEANNTVLYSRLWSHIEQILRRGDGTAPNVVVSAGEHPSVLEPLKRLSQFGIDLRLVNPDSRGEIDPSAVFNACSNTTALLSIMLANNETGSLYPVKEISRLVHSRFPYVLIHSDGAQALGKIPLVFSELGINALSLSGHKIGALSGVGALVFESNINFSPLLLGGAQEKRSRAGTENLAGIVSFGLAVRKAAASFNERTQRMRHSRDEIKRRLKGKISRIICNCEGAALLPNTLNFRIPGISAEDLVIGLDLKGISVSSGSACSSGKTLPSHVLRSMGQSEEEAAEGVRVSVSGEETEEQIGSFVDYIAEIADRQVQS